MTDGNTEAEHLLQLELNLRLELLDLRLNVIVIREGSRELSGLVKTGSQQTGNLRDEGLRGEEGVELAGELLDELSVLVELLKIINGPEVDSELLGGLTVSGISENADLHSGSGEVWESHGTSETLVSLSIVVLETDLEFDSLNELSRLLLRTIKDGLYGLLQVVDIKLASHVLVWNLEELYVSVD